jgi:copper transport protein
VVVCRRRALRACAVLVLCAGLGLLAGAGSASAHAALISTEPGPGAVVPTMPATVSLTFSEPVVVSPEGVRVFGPDGAKVDDGHSTHFGGPDTVGVGLPGHDRAQLGTYTVSWRVISADSHPVAGAFTFSVGHPSIGRVPTATQASGSSAVDVSYAITRAAAFTAYALLVGSVAFVLVCWPEAIRRRSVRRAMLGGWAGLLATTMATLLLQGLYANGLGLDQLLDPAVVSATVASRLGTALTARLMLLALAGGYLVLLCAWLGHLARQGRMWFGALGAALALSLAGTWAAADHAAVGLQPELAVPIDIMHLVAMGAWFGGLVTLVIVLQPSLGGPHPEAPAAPERAVVRFSSIATGAVAVLIGTGSYQSWRQLGSWTAFGSTDYGRLLLVKLGIVALLLGVATRSHRWVTQHRRVLIGVGAATRAVTPATSGPLLRRSVLVEATLGALVIGVTALLVNAEPGRTATTGSPGPAHLVLNYDTGGPNGRGQLIVDVDPAATGPNTIHVSAEDPSGTRHELAELRTTLTLPTRQLGPFVIPLQHPEPGGYDASGVQLPYPGAWQLRMTVRTSEVDETTVEALIDIS